MIRFRTYYYKDCKKSSLKNTVKVYFKNFTDDSIKDSFSNSEKLNFDIFCKSSYEKSFV